MSPAKEIRAAALRALRHLLQTHEQAKAVLIQRLDIFIARCALLCLIVSVDFNPRTFVEYSC